MIYTKKCPWCLEELKTRNAKKIHCKNSHKTYMSQYKNGKRQPPNHWSINQRFTPEEAANKIKELEQKLEPIKKEFDKKADLYSDGSKEKNIEETLIKLRHNKFRIEAEIRVLEKQKTVEPKSIFLDIKSISNIKSPNKKPKNYYEFSHGFFDYNEESFDEEGQIDDWDFRVLQFLGSLPRPFIASLCNESDMYVAFAMWASKSFIKFYESKAVFFIDDNIGEWGKEIIEKFWFDDENFKLAKVEKTEQIERIIKDIQPEFVFIKVQNINHNFVQRLKIEYSKTSIFLLLKSPANSFSKISDLIIQYVDNDNCDYEFVKGGSSDHAHYFFESNFF